MFKTLASLPRAAVGGPFARGFAVRPLPQTCRPSAVVFANGLYGPRRWPDRPFARPCHAKGTGGEPSPPSPPPPGEPLTPTEKLKKAAKEYGSVLVAFHVGISLVSLGTVYAAVLYGVDVQQWIGKLGMQGADDGAKIVAGASQFIIAYAIHKSFAPVRISITLVSVPLIVRYLRAKGIMKAKG